MEQALAPEAVPPKTAPSEHEQHDSASNEQLTTLQKQLDGRYRIIKQLGQGGQGTVYLAEKLATHEHVAIKQLLIQSVKDWRQYDMFQREASALQRISVKGVAKLHETMELLDIETPMALIIQDYIAGEPMQKFIASGHRFRIDQIGEILEQLLEILELLHKQDPPIVHRDLKPSNVILRYEANSDMPSVHLIDFGAVSNPQLKGGGSTVVGTYGYMAPEQLMGCAEPASDIYSLAIIAVYLMSGVAPENYEIQDFHVLIEPHLEHLPYEITAFLRRMLEPRIENRLTNTQTIKQFFEAVKTQKFNTISTAIHSQLKKNTKYKLDEVYYYHQAGNIELWQELGDITPRKLSYALRRRIKTNVNSLILFISTLVLIILANIVMYILAYFWQFDVNAIINAHLIIVPLAVALSFAAIKYWGWGAKRTAGKFDELLFFKEARKSMATVIRIEFIPLSNWTSQTPGVSFKPTWKIYYSFNPPDDSSPDALIHTAITHASVDHLKEGDMIPILYLIDNHEGEYVYSTPYPIPAQDQYYLYYTIGDSDQSSDTQGN